MVFSVYATISLPAVSTPIPACDAKKSGEHEGTLQGGCCSLVSTKVVVQLVPPFVERITASFTWPVALWFSALSLKYTFPFGATTPPSANQYSESVLVLTRALKDVPPLCETLM